MKQRIVGAIAVLAFAPSIAAAAIDDNTLQKYVDPSHFTSLPFGSQSHWLQPWRAYLETRPASKLRDALGINFQFAIDPMEANALCKHLKAHGVKHIRVEFSWAGMSEGGQLNPVYLKLFDPYLKAAKEWGLRPMIVLNSNHGAPCPMKTSIGRLTAPASRGDKIVHFEPDDLKGMIVGQSGISNLSGNWAAECLFTDISGDGTVTLSRPLPKAITGTVKVSTLSFLPFYPYKIKATGQTPEQFTRTAQGWLDYVGAICSHSKAMMGGEGDKDAGFDLEVWNELSFGSYFLNINRYYDHPIVVGDERETQNEILRRTVAYVRDPDNHFPNVGITDGFESQRPWGASSALPVGTTALSKHPYASARKFSFDSTSTPGAKVLNARAGTDTDISSRFTPTYTSFFPEYLLTGIQTETMVRDLAPIPNIVNRVTHGRGIKPDGSRSSDPAPTVWITEVNIDPRGKDLNNPAAGLSGSHGIEPSMTPADADHLKAKALLRYLTAYVNKGVDRIYFFCAKDKQPFGLGLVSNEFFKAVDEKHGEYPGASAEFISPTMSSLGRLMAKMQGDISHRDIKPITLESLEEPDPRTQFEGEVGFQRDAPHPSLYNRDVFAFFPFQCTKTRYVIPVYVMTRNMSLLYKSDAPVSDVTRFDMPEETFRLRLSGISGNPTLKLYDPLDGSEHDVKTLEHRGSRMRI